ncbi:MAG: discoidin domain-containing protein [Caldilineaceae bacterium]|nr:discoidin domain-containing protein [Caldilineaceae bacterium]
MNNSRLPVPRSGCFVATRERSALSQSCPPCDPSRLRPPQSWTLLCAAFFAWTLFVLTPAAALIAQDAIPTVEPAAVETTRQLFLPIVINAGTDSASQTTEQPLSETPNQSTAGEANEALVDSHSQNDYVLAELARQRNEPPFVVPASAAATGPLNVVGRWDAPVRWPFVFATAANLPDGRIIAWGGNNTTSFSGGSNTYAAIWEPTTGQFLSRNHTSHSMFCAIPTMLEDGRVFVNGGDGTRERTSIFDYRTNAWTRVEDMNRGRWYNGAVALPNGRVFTLLGDPGGPYPELWTPNQGWSLLTGANLNNGILNYSGYQSTWLPYLHLAPNGRIFHSGPTTQMNWLDPTGNGSIASAGLTNTWYPKYSSAIMYDQGKILVAGGATSGSNTAPGTNQAMLIDLNGTTPTKNVITPMSYARKFNNAVMLPNGEVMIIGGNTSGVEFSDQGTILTPEIWNPTTQSWRSVADISVPRNYHSVALLMTDGRVWSGGGGLCNCSADHPDHQIYWPPYLFNADGSLATRPTMTTAPTEITYGSTFQVAATANLAKFTLIKMSGVTHNLNSDLRYLNLPFTTTGAGQYELTVPANENVLTPGYWMLFAINGQGVPSVAKVIQVKSTPLEAPPGSTIRYVKLEALSEVSGYPWSSMAEFYVLDSRGAPLNRSAWVVTADSQELQGENGAASNIADGNIATIWHTQWQGANPPPPHWIVVDLGGDYQISGFRYLPRQSSTNGRIGNYRFYVSTDGVNWGGPVAQGTFPNTTDEQTVGVTLNQPPLITNPGGQSGLVGAMVNLPISASDAEGNPLQFSATNLPAGLTINSSTGAIVGTLATAGDYAVTVTVSDGTATATAAFAWQVTAPGALNLALGRPATSSSNETTQLVASNAVDGSPATRWASQYSDPQWLQVDLGAIYVINQVVLTWEAAYGRAYALQLSTDGTTWQTIYSTTTGDGGTDTLSGLTGQGRYLRLYGTQRGTQWGYSLWELAVYGSPATLKLDPMISAPKPINAAVTYTAQISNGVNPRVKWLFGDGTPETAYATNLTVAHTFPRTGIYVVKATAIDDRGVEQSTTFVQAIHLPTTANRPTASMNLLYEARANANGRIWVINPDNDTVSVFDAVTNSKVAEIAVGKAPRSLALAPTGRIWVTNKGASTISIINPATLAVVQTMPLAYGTQPYGIVFAPTGNVGYVALEGAGKVLRFDATTAAPTGSVEVGLHVRHLSMPGDGSKLYVSRFITPRVPGEETATPQVANGGGEVVVLNAGNFTVDQIIRLRYSDKPDTEVQGRGIPNYLGPLVISPDGVNGWLPSKQDNILRGTLRDGNNLNFQNTVRAISSHIDIAAAAEDYPGRLDHDNAGVASTALFDKSGSYLFVALETNRQVAVVDAYSKQELFRIDVGRAPQGLALAPDGLTLYVNNFMDRTLSVIDLRPLINEGKTAVPTLATVNSVATEKLAANVLIGKQLFYDAKDPRLALDSYISCASCHNDGGQDGRVWDLTGMGEGLRNTISLNGHAGMGQGLLHWSGNFDEVQDFEAQIRNLAGGTGLLTDAQFNTGTRNQSMGDPKAGVSADLDALAAYVTSLNAFAASPYRNADGTLTTAGAVGKTIFQNQNCTQCHSGVAFTDSGVNTWRSIGTLKPSSGNRLGGTLPGIDTPTLRDIWATAPYLHDGSAATLADAIRAHNGVTMPDNDLIALVAYLQQIDGSELVSVNLPPVVTLTAPSTGATFTQGATINLTADASDNSGIITKVEFYVGTTLLNTDGAAPFSFAWSNVAAGAYALTAKAYDDMGASTTSAVVTITVNPVGGNGTGLTAHYFNNISLANAPVLQRTEAVAFDWGYGAPGAGLPADNFSARWMGLLEAPTADAYQFQTISDDGVRLWVNGTLVINNWTDHGATTDTSAVVNLTAGMKNTLILEYYEKAASATIKLLWKSPTTNAFVPIPVDRLYAVTNLAQGKSSSQSSTANGGSAARAVDGNPNGNWHGGSVSHTNNNTNAWWQVNLGSSYALNNIVLWNRTDCCANRLTNFYVFVANSDMTGRSFSSLVNDNTVWRYRMTGQAPNQLVIPATVNGRYVRVQLAGTNYLSLAEVQVFGR